jgi:uncharacterized protein YndB with AHSA1/START domain/DNA-binding transcriptional ArsR family regulator
MVQHLSPHINASFAALADATRRGVLDQLARGDASITDLADKFEMTLTGMKKHVGVLELAGLVTTEKVGRVRTCRIGPCRLEEEMEWIARYRRVWDARFEALDGVIDELKRQEKPVVARKESEARRTTVQKRSEREVVVTRTFDAPARLVFEAWSKPELFKKWWVPRSMGMTLRSCEMDVRTGGKYRLVFGDDPANPMAFFGNYLEVVPDKRIVWTNEESGDAGSVTTVTFEERDGKTLLVMSELYPTKEALDAAGTGAQEAMNETFGQLDELLAELSAR